jgi:hypothetical protein
MAGESNLKIKMDYAYDYYSLRKLDEDPVDLFEKTCDFFDEVQGMMESENLRQARAAAYEEYTIATMAAMIFGSNMIEKAGSTEAIRDIHQPPRLHRNKDPPPQPKSRRLP